MCIVHVHAVHSYLLLQPDLLTVAVVVVSQTLWQVCG